MGWSRFADRALARANALQDGFLLVRLENDLKEAASQTRSIPRPPSTYNVIEAGNVAFQVVEADPDGGEPHVIAAFTTRAAAIEWLTDLRGVRRALSDINDFPTN
jgi:hypothetical protein